MGESHSLHDTGESTSFGTRAIAEITRVFPSRDGEVVDSGRHEGIEARRTAAKTGRERHRSES